MKSYLQYRGFSFHPAELMAPAPRHMRRWVAAAGVIIVDEGAEGPIFVASFPNWRPKDGKSVAELAEMARDGVFGIEADGLLEIGSYKTLDDAITGLYQIQEGAVFRDLGIS